MSSAKVDRFTPHTTNQFIYCVHALQSKRRELLGEYNTSRQMHDDGVRYQTIEDFEEMEDKIESIEEAILILKQL